MNQTRIQNQRYRLFYTLLLACLIVLFSASPKIHAEGELRFGLSQDSVVLGPEEAVTVNINYFCDVPVKNVNVVLNSQDAGDFSVQNILSSSSSSVNGTGSLGSITIIAPTTSVSGNIVLSATAENADDASIKYVAQVTIPVSVNLPPAVETEISGTAAEAETAPATTAPATLPTQVGVKLTLKLNGVGDAVNVNVSENTPALLPEGYSEVVAEVQSQNIRTYKKAGRMPLIYISLVDGGAESLYSLDAAQGFAYRFYPDVYTNIGGKSAIVTSLTEPAPDNALVSQSLELNGQTTTAWVGDLKGEEYTVIRAEIDGKATTLYRYSIAADGAATIGLFDYNALMNPPSPTPIATTTLSSSAAAGVTEKNESNTKDSGSGIDWFFWVLFIVFVLMSAGLLVLYLRNKAKRDSQDYRLAAHHYDDPGVHQKHSGRSAQGTFRAAAARKPVKGIQLKELTPNDFDDVDRYFAERRETVPQRRAETAARSGVRKPQVHQVNKGHAPNHNVSAPPKNYGDAQHHQSPVARNPHRSYYKPDAQASEAPGYVNRQRPNSAEPLVIKRVRDNYDNQSRHDEVLFDANDQRYTD